MRTAVTKRSFSSHSDKGGGRDPTIHLSGWIKEPYLQDKVIAAVKAADRPLTLREISQSAEVPLRSANRILYRLFKKSLVGRYKLPIQRHAFCRKRWVCVPYAAKRMLYVYRWMGQRDSRGSDASWTLAYSPPHRGKQS